MQELEKILAEIDDLIVHSAWPCMNLIEKEKVKEIIRDHIIDKGTDDGWIPVEERLPEEKISPVTMDFYEYLVTARFGNVIDVRCYKYGDGHWWHGPGIVDKYVVAWQPLPEPYRPVKI